MSPENLSAPEEVWRRLKVFAAAYADDDAEPTLHECMTVVRRIVKEIVGSEDAFKERATTYYAEETLAMIRRRRVGPRADS